MGGAGRKPDKSYRADHAFVDFQIPVDSKKLPLVYVHGYGGSGVCWQMTPDGREGFATLMLRRGWSSYVVDLPGRGRAGRTSAITTAKPVADEMFWFDIWRIGIWPNYNEGVQFPKDSVSLSQFFREMTPDISDHKQDVPALSALAKRIGNHVLVTHSAGGFPGWMSAMQNSEVKGVVSYEPGGFVFPEGEVPDRIDGLTGGVAGIPVTDGTIQTTHGNSYCPIFRRLYSRNALQKFGRRELARASSDGSKIRGSGK